MRTRFPTPISTPRSRRSPEPDQEVLRLWAWEDLAPAEVAVALDVSPNAASIRLHRAKAKLADALRKMAPPAGHLPTRTPRR